MTTVFTNMCCKLRQDIHTLPKTQVGCRNDDKYWSTKKIKPKKSAMARLARNTVVILGLRAIPKLTCIRNHINIKKHTNTHDPCTELLGNLKSNGKYIFLRIAATITCLAKLISSIVFICFLKKFVISCNKGWIF